MLIIGSTKIQPEKNFKTLLENGNFDTMQRASQRLSKKGCSDKLQRCSLAHHCLFNIHFLPIIISKAISLARATTDGLLVGGGTASKETYFYNTQKKQPRHLARHH